MLLATQPSYNYNYNYNATSNKPLSAKRKERRISVDEVRCGTSRRKHNSKSESNGLSGWELGKPPEKRRYKSGSK